MSIEDDDLLKQVQELFLIEADGVLSEVGVLFLSLEKENSNRKETFEQIKRLAHNFKGGGKAAGFDKLVRFSHLLENLLVGLSSGTIKLTPNIIQLLLECSDALKFDVAELRRDPKNQIDHSGLESRLIEAFSSPGNTSTTLSEEFSDDEVRIFPFVPPVEKTPKIIREQDEFIRIPMKRVDDLLNSFGEQVILLSALDHYKDNLDKYKDEIYRTIFNLKKLALDLQQSTMALRMVNIKSLFSKLERAIRDAAKSIDKKVTCEIIGAEQELDKGLVDQLSDPLIHMVRNAVDHGLESSKLRVQRGKSEVGRISLIARREGGCFVIEIKDDGGGMDPEVIRQKAIEKGLISEFKLLNEKEIFDLIFESGFSTKEQVSELSGRGVGIIVPSSQVLEIVDPRGVECRPISGGRVVFQLRDSILNLISLPKTLKAWNTFSGVVDNSKLNTKEMILISEVEGNRVGFLIHRIIGIQRIVQKPLGPEMAICPGAAGVTILGDGSPAIILDLQAIVSRYSSEDSSKYSPESEMQIALQFNN